MEVGIAVIQVRVWTKVVDGDGKTKTSLRNSGDIKLTTLGNTSDLGVWEWEPSQGIYYTICL